MVGTHPVHDGRGHRPADLYSLAGRRHADWHAVGTVALVGALCEGLAVLVQAASVFGAVRCRVWQTCLIGNAKLLHVPKHLQDEDTINWFRLLSPSISRCRLDVKKHGNKREVGCQHSHASLSFLI